MEHTHHILSSIRKIVRVVNLESKQLEKDYSISIPQLLTLKFLYERSDYRASQKDVKNYLQLNASTVTGIISRLEKRELVAKFAKKEDKRTSIIVLTAKGFSIATKIPEPLHQRLSENIDRMSNEEVEQLKAAFDLITGFLDVDKVDASPIITAETHLNNSADKKK